MQTHRFEQYEFDSIASEQEFRFAAAPRAEFPSLEAFARRLPRESQLAWSLLPQPLPLDQHPRVGHVRQLLQQFTCSPEDPSNMRVVAILGDEWNDLELLLDSADRYFWFHWDTTA